MVEQGGEPFLLPFSCCLSHTAQSLGHAFPTLCRAHVRLNDVLLSLCPSLPSLRGKLPFVVRLVHWCRVGGGARLGAGLRPPLKLHGRFSRMQLSRRTDFPSVTLRRDKRNQADHPNI